MTADGEVVVAAAYATLVVMRVSSGDMVWNFTLPDIVNPNGPSLAFVKNSAVVGVLTLLRSFSLRSFLLACHLLLTLPSAAAAWEQKMHYGEIPANPRRDGRR